jgi:YidC/Oxa1 family membrane protein insertase
MQLNPQQPDPVQQQIFAWMPVVFTFLLASFPAGLVIYWAWSNTLSLAQQYYIMKRQGVEVHLAGNVSRNFKSLAAMGEHVTAAVKQWLPGASSEEQEKPKSDGRERSKTANKPKGKDKHH